MISPENLSTPFKFSSNQYNYKHTADMIIPGTKIKIKDQNWFESNCSYYDKIKDVWVFSNDDPNGGRQYQVTRNMLSFCEKEATILGELHYPGSEILMIDIDDSLYGWDSSFFEVVHNFLNNDIFSSSIDDYDIAIFGDFLLGICRVTGHAIPEFFSSPEEIKDYIIKNYGKVE